MARNVPARADFSLLITCFIDISEDSP